QGAFAGILAIALVLAIYAANPGGTAFGLREAWFDRLTSLWPATGPDTHVAVVNIDRESLARIGPWPWRRKQIAALLARLADFKPQAIALDVLLDGGDRNGPGAVLSRLSVSEQRPDLQALASGFPDEDKAIGAVMDSGATLVLGLGIAQAGGDAFPPLVVATEGEGDVPFQPVTVPGFSGPPPAIATSAAGLGVLSLDTDRDGRLRRVPLIFSSSDPKVPALQASFALETVRAASGAGSIILDLKAKVLQAGSSYIPLSGDGLLRLYPRDPSWWEGRTISAWRILAGEKPSVSENTIFVVGSSAPQAGAYLPTAFAGAQPSLAIYAAAIDQIRGGRHLVRLPGSPASELALGVIAGLAALAAALVLPPVWLSAATAALLAGLLSAGVLAFRQYGVLADMLPAAAAVLAGAIAASLTVHGRIRANKAAVEARFARYMSPAVVEILARNPQTQRIAPQRREVTAIFTDLEGFTPFSERTPPAELVATLDRYFELIAGVAIAHGGMIDKIVGDAIHVFFNMPLDQPDHVERALGCVRAIHAATEGFRNEPRQKDLGLGRTRIGMDTGWATVGDIGGGGKLDYTAHGEAINRAARLQALARDYPSGILIGEGAASRLASTRGLQLAGEVTPRGLSKAQKIYTLV
ncbi:MAG: CHASE2 domain-containing protein, partial [Beijerinckiaceae bacterium]